MGRKHNIKEVWDSMKKKLKQDRQNAKNPKNINNFDSNAFIIDPDKQKQQKILKKLKNKLKPKKISNENKKKLNKLKQKKQKKNEYELIWNEMKETNDNNKNIPYNVFKKIQGRETKKEYTKRIYSQYKAGITIDKSKIFKYNETPQLIINELKQQNELNALNNENTNSDNSKNNNNNNSNINNEDGKDYENMSFSFGNLVKSDNNELMIGADDKRYQMKGINIISTRKNGVKRQKNETILFDYTVNERDKRDEVKEVVLPTMQDASDTDDDIYVINSDDSEETIKNKKRWIKLKKRRKRKYTGFLENNNDSDGDSTRKRKKFKKNEMELLQEFLECKSSDMVMYIEHRKRIEKSVKVYRLEGIEEQRLKLPIIGEEYRIMDKIKHNDVVLICGETGSGKSTQLPQFLYEYGFSFKNHCIINDEYYEGLIGITEPRRVAAISVSKRVSIELNVDKHVGYKIRYDQNITQEAHIVFMTDGILLREIQYDFLLRKYSVIIIDEAHERNINTDVLIGLLSKIVKQRRNLFNKYKKDKINKIYPLKLLIMSATLKVNDFQNEMLFNPIPKPINVESRQHPVTIHFNKHTPSNNTDYLDEIYKKICKIHIMLPHGHLLVFLTGRREIEYMCERVRERFKNPTKKFLPKYNIIKDKLKQKKDKKKENETKTMENDEEKNDNITYIKASDISKLERQDEDNYDETMIGVEDLIMKDEMETTNDEDKTNEDEKETVPEHLKPILKHWKYRSYGKVNVLPLYSLMEPKQQEKIFQKQDRNVRLIVIATNIAETSITIPGIKYVLDSGKVKKKVYNPKNNMSTMVVDYISKASATQRSGRAGRTSAGHCYRLYSSAFYDRTMQDYFEPEILRIPIQNLILQMKSMNIQNVSKFPFPTPPSKDYIYEGLRILETIGALKYDDNGKYGLNSELEQTNKILMCLKDSQYLSKDEEYLKITKMGTAMLEYPINVRLSKMLILGNQGNCLSYVLGIVCVLSIESLQFMPDEIDKILQKTLTQNDIKDDTQNSNAIFDTKNEEKKLLRKKKRQMVLNARYKFCDNKSDVLSYLNIFGCYEYAKNKNKFCNEYFLRSKNMFEAHNLMHQLKGIINKIITNNSIKNDIKLSLNPPNMKQKILLRQIIAAGLIDQIARPWPDNKSFSNNDDNDVRYLNKLSKAYQCMSNPDKPVYIHPSSYIYTRKKIGVNYIQYRPELVVYYSLHKSETNKNDNDNSYQPKTYMHHVTVVEPHWLLKIAPHLCLISEPLHGIGLNPFYDGNDDVIKCYVEVRFGPYQWELPRQTIIHPDINERYKYFAMYILEGKVYKEMQKLKQYLKYRPISIINSANNTGKALVNALKTYEIDNKYKLDLQWLNNAQFLYNEIQSWIQSSKIHVFKQIWPLH